MRVERTRHLPPEEAQRLLDACNPDFRDLVLAAMHTGFRSKGTRLLRWYNVDLAGNPPQNPTQQEGGKLVRFAT